MAVIAANSIHCSHGNTHVLSDIFVEHLSREGSREEEKEKEREKVVTQKCWPRLYLFAGLLKLDEARRR